ncbi:MAG: hypothetical protein PHX68_00310 [Alphaproteobacteria bacterium]|nr:hypothetical protein [Alphaproteobacteria bacterium]
MPFIAVFASVLLASFKAAANPACAVCTVAVGASLMIARRLGIDDCVVGVWSGAMMAIIGYWMIRFCEKRGWRFPLRGPILMALSVASIGFVYTGEMPYAPAIIGFLYIDSFLLANIIGAGVFIAGMRFYEGMKARNGGHAHFPFEKVLVPVAAVALMSLAVHHGALCRCHEAMELFK